MQPLMTLPKKYFWDKAGKPLAFGKIYIHQPGTTNPLPTYTTAAGDVANPYPIILNGEGYTTIYLTGPFDIVVDDANNAEIWTDDDVPTSLTEEWINCVVPTYVSTVSFKMTGDFTAEYDLGRRVRIDNDIATFSYSTVATVSFGAGETTVTLSDAIVDPGVIQACASVISQNALPVDPNVSTEGKTVHDMASDGDYSLTTGQAQNSIIEITDTGVLLTVPRNIEVPTGARTWVFINSTAQVLTVKTAAGTGVPVDAGATAHVLSDGTNVTNQEEPYTANSKAVHDMTSDADYSLTDGQAQSAVVDITDTNPFLSTARNIIMPNLIRPQIVVNSTLQVLTFKTAAGTGVAVDPSSKAFVHSDGTNIQLSQGLASATQKGLVEKATKAEMEAETADKYSDAALLRDSPVAAKAWVNFNGTGTVAILDSNNVTSITDNGVGDYTINFTIAMSSANYAWSQSCKGNVASTASFTIGQDDGDAKSTTALQIRAKFVSSSVTEYRDYASISVNVFSS